MQGDGKLVVVGFSTSLGSSFPGIDTVSLVRYNADGSLDTTFGTTGRVTSDFGQSEQARSLAIQPDGKIVIGGQVITTGSIDFLLARYNPDGSLDSTFGSGGWVSTDFGSSTDSVFSIAIQADGKIVAVGQAFDFGTGNDFAVARYNPDGSLDTTFDSDGMVTTAFGAGSDVATGVIILPDGKIVVAGQAFVSGTGNDFGLVRYHANGTLDASFGVGGMVTTAFTTSTDFASGLIRQPDGKLVAAGTAFVAGTGNVFALARYNEDGSLDPDFDGDGKVTTDFVGASGDVARAVALHSDGRIVAAGAAGGNFAVAWYNPDGSLAANFGTGGLVTTDFGASNDSAFGVTVQADGKVVAAGLTTLGTNQDFALARYLGDNAPPTAVANGPYEVDEGGSIALSAAGSSDPEQDASMLTYEWDLDGDNVFGETGIDAARGDETGASPTFSAANLDGPANITVTLRVTDSLGAADEDTAQITVNNVAATVGTITAPLDPQIVSATIHASASFADAGLLDTHTAVWDWGDSTTSAGTVSESGGSGTVTGSHVYGAAGVYTVTLTVTDDDGDSAQSVFQYIVIYNPSDGFVTGGGTIDSPAGALASDPTASGIAQFAFVSKYQTGAHVPTGETRFRFNLGNFQFESTSYDWMVISGAKARYRGVGTVNGAAGYGFQITVIDGDRPGGGGVDRFRIRIWSLAGNATVYDNQLGYADDDDPITALRGGSIRIQS